MESVDLRLTSAFYHMEKDRTVVCFTGRTKDGDSVLVRFKGFRPYFYIVEPNQSAITTLENDKDVVRVDACTLWHDRKLKKSLRVSIKFPKDTPMHRERYERLGNVVFACDIPFHLRFIFDYDVGSCARFHGTWLDNDYIRSRYLVPRVFGAEAIEDIEPFYPPLTVMGFDIENAISDHRIYCISAVHRVGNEGRTTGDNLERTVFDDDDEKVLLEKFFRHIQEIDADVLCGHNILRHDLPIILERCTVHGIYSKFGRDGSGAWEAVEGKWNTHGRVFADSWMAIRAKRPKRETLDFVSKKYLGVGKIDVDSKQIDKEWNSDRAKVLEYCKLDAELSLRLVEFVGSINKALDLGNVARLPLSESYEARTSLLIDSAMIRECDRREIGVPPSRKGEKKDKIVGGYVKEPRPGLYKWIATVDVRSMYPSQIIDKNICMTTLDPENGTISSPHNPDVKYLPKSVKVGVLPYLMQKWWEQRDLAKRKKKETAKNGDTWAEKYYDGLQGSIKVVMNACYGTLSSSFYRFTNSDIGATITAFSREEIKAASQKLESLGYSVIYNDTDSAMIQMPFNTVDECVKDAQRITALLSHDVLEFDFEKLLSRWFTHGAKKRYFGKIVWPQPPSDSIEDSMVIRGYETRRTDSFDLQEQSLLRIMELVMRDDIDGAIKHARETVQKAKKGRVDVSELVVSRGAQVFYSENSCAPVALQSADKDSEESEKAPEPVHIKMEVGDRTLYEHSLYKNPNSMANVQAARKIMKDGIVDFIPGMKVSWVVIDSQSTPQSVEPWYMNRPFPHKPDFAYYAQRLARSLARVTEVFGWDETALLSNSREKALRDFGFEGIEGPKGERRKRRRKRTKPTPNPGAMKLFE